METLIHKLLTENYQQYYRLAYSYVHNQQDAMDIVQEGAYKAILKCQLLREQEHAGTWIYRIMVNEALAFLRKHKREMPDLEQHLTDQPCQQDVYEDLDLKEAINRLEPEDQTIITLRYFEDLPIQQVADIMEENTNTVKSRLYRALKKLKLSLAE